VLFVLIGSRNSPKRLTSLPIQDYRFRRERFGESLQVAKRYSMWFVTGDPQKRQLAV
jgi:hypothetical protein